MRQRDHASKREAEYSDPIEQRKDRRAAGHRRPPEKRADPAPGRSRERALALESPGGKGGWELSTTVSRRGLDEGNDLWTQEVDSFDDGGPTTDRPLPKAPGYYGMRGKHGGTKS